MKRHPESIFQQRILRRQVKHEFNPVKGQVVIHNFRERLHGLGARLRPRAWEWRPAKEQIVVEAPAAQTVQAFKVFSRWASIVALVVGYHVLLGWLFDIGVLKSPWPTFSTMKLQEAFCSMLAGGALYLVQQGPERRPYHRGLILVCAGLVTLIGCLTLVEYAFHVNLGIDQWFYQPGPLSDIAGDAPGRMTLMSAVAFLMLGLGLMLVDRRRGLGSAEALGLISAALALLAIASYLYAAKAFEGQMPLYSAVVIFLLAGGLLCVRSDQGFMAKVTSNSFGGIMARRLLPATLLIPLVLGWLQHLGQRAGMYGSEPGLALFAVANVLLFLSVIWWGVNSLHRMDTKRRQAEQDLQATAAKLARSNADLEQFAYVASHDLKEPLRAISGSVQILQERYRHQLDPRAEEVIKHTVDGAARMQTLIDDLLTYSRLTTREAPLAPTDCREIVQEVQANLELAIKESRAVVTYDWLPVVKADRTQLLQVFQNLISNGIKYRSQRTPKIHISSEDAGTEWLLSVRDNGIGIAPQYAERIFRIFQRLHTRKEYPGTGIGLAVCKKIIERHGGRIWVESEPEEGSTFFFTLPKA